MDIRLIVERYNTPESLQGRTDLQLEELYTVIENSLSPHGRLASALSGGTQSQTDTLQHIKGNILAEMKRRDALPKSEIAGADLPLPQKIHLPKDTKTDMMRIIDALYELKFFQDSNGIALGREKAFALFGSLFEGGFTGFAQALSQSYDKTSKEKNTEIFDKMKGKVAKKMEETLERSKKK